MKAYLSPSAYCTPRSITEDKQAGREPRAVLHVVIPHGKTKRTVPIELSEDDLLTIIANAADALRYLGQARP